MSGSILTHTKKVLGIAEDFDAFDVDVLMYINSALGTLQQIGIGPEEGLIVTDDTTKWDAIGVTPSKLGMVKTYIALSVRSAFDPPTSSYGIEAVRKQIEQLEWRLYVHADLNEGVDQP